jgi:hypothetical protein
MKKAVVIFGGPTNLFKERLEFFKYFEKKFKVRIDRTSELKLKTKLEGVGIDFLFAFCPQRDKAYLDSKKYIEKHYNEKVPLPAKELCPSIKKADVVLFFGTCGSFKGNKKQIYVPNKFMEINYSGDTILKKEIKKNPGKEVELNNVLNKRGRKATAITSNLTLMPACVENREEKLVEKFGAKLSKWGDVIDKESYQIVKNLKNRFPVGVGLVCSDVILKKQFLKPKHNFEFRNTFNRFVTESIKEIVLLNNS